MRTVGQRPVADQHRLAEETLEVYAPLAHRLGIWDFKSELEELGFMYRQAGTSERGRREAMWQ